MLEYLAANWQWILVIFYILEKIVKLTPTRYDDIVLDIFADGLGKLVGIKKKES